MIQCNSTIKLNMASISQLKEAQIMALEQTGEQLHTIVQQAQIIPRRDGALQGEAFFVDTSKSSKGKVSLIHATPYARRMYFHPEYKFNKGPWEEEIKNKDGSVSHVKHDGNPNAKGKWYEDYVPGGKYDQVTLIAYQSIFRRITGI